MKSALYILILLLALNNINAQKSYDARINDKEVLTPAASEEPKINGPKIYGVRPGKKFIYRIPCQGERPIEFKVKGLSQGLILDSENGIISGVVPMETGPYKMVFVAENEHGKDSCQFKLIIGDKIALTPPTGWNSWGGQMLTVTDETIRKAADVFVENGFADVGFQYISIDDCWMKIRESDFKTRPEIHKEKHEGFNFDGIVGDVRDSLGNVIPNKNFPDMGAMTDYIHSFGLKAGIYSGPGPKTCQGFVGSFGYEKHDADQYAQWGFDLIKYDLCSGRDLLKCLKDQGIEYPQSELWRPMATYLRLQDRDILFNLCQYGWDEPWEWASTLGISSWRIGGDLNHHVDTYFKYALRIATELREYSKPGQWNDPDFMYIHRLRDVQKMVNPSKEIPLSTNQRYQYVSLWSIVCAPFFFSADIHEIDEFTIKLITNSDVININQDELGHVAEVLKNENDEVIMLKKLVDGSKVLAIFNTNMENEKVIDVELSSLGLNKKADVYDVWRQTVLGSFKKSLSVHLSPNGVGLFILK
ncbi:MAG: alpha-galactosidase [Bacteroidetes bacterium]|nr:alpha-galactosidase [Bacteroidota bacterium]